MAVDMHDYKYRAIAWTPLRDRRWDLKAFRSECLRPIALAFLTNLTRTSRFALMPALLALQARRSQLWTDYIDQKLGRPINPESKEYSGSLSKEEAELASPLIERCMSLSDSEVRELIEDIGIKYIEHSLQVDKDMQQSMMAVLSTIVLESWTAFESLASDLWVTAVDQGPKDVRNRLMLSKNWLTPDDQITPEKIHEIEYDARQLGSFLREVGKVSFQKLDYIRRFYSAALGKETEQLFEKTGEGYIFALSGFRNALVHNAGRADKRFVKAVARFEEFRSIKPKDILVLDGEVVRKLHNSAILLGLKLIQFVDNVLTPVTP
jgi:hypothetical protein